MHVKLVETYLPQYDTTFWKQHFGAIKTILCR